MTRRIWRRSRKRWPRQGSESGARSPGSGVRRRGIAPTGECVGFGVAAGLRGNKRSLRVGRDDGVGMAAPWPDAWCICMSRKAIPLVRVRPRMEPGVTVWGRAGSTWALPRPASDAEFREIEQGGGSQPGLRMGAVRSTPFPQVETRGSQRQAPPELGTVADGIDISGTGRRLLSQEPEGCRSRGRVPLRRCAA